jgi:hypothetical protein
MLECHIDLKNLDDYNLQCGSCNKCKGNSILNYPFQRDLLNSDDLVKEIIKYVSNGTGYFCERTTINKNPDINVYRNSSCKDLVCRIEAKFLQGQAFMKAKNYLDLYAKEALVVDEPKLNSYIQCKEEDRKKGREVPIFIVWKFDRPCDDVGGIAVFQEIDELERLHRLYGYVRAYQRGTGANDYQNGIRMGVVDKYHFSIRECEPIEKLVPIIQEI